MKEMNLSRLLESCCVDIPNEVQDALHDYIMECDISLDDVNIDDLYVNGVSNVSKEEYEEYKDAYYFLCDDARDEDYIYILN